MGRIGESLWEEIVGRGGEGGADAEGFAGEEADGVGGGYGVRRRMFERHSCERAEEEGRGLRRRKRGSSLVPLVTYL